METVGDGHDIGMDRKEWELLEAVTVLSHEAGKEFVETLREHQPDTIVPNREPDESLLDYFYRINALNRPRE